MDVLNMTADKGVPKVLLFLAEGFEDLEAVSVLDVCGWTEYREHIPKVLVVTTGIRPEVKGKKATTYFLSRHHDHAERLQALGCTPTQGPIDVCDRIISCSGPVQSVDVALLLLESLIGPEAVREVRRFMAGMG